MLSPGQWSIFMYKNKVVLENGCITRRKCSCNVLGVPVLLLRSFDVTAGNCVFLRGNISYMWPKLINDTSEIIPQRSHVFWYNAANLLPAAWNPTWLGYRIYFQCQTSYISRLNCCRFLVSLSLRSLYCFLSVFFLLHCVIMLHVCLSIRSWFVLYNSVWTDLCTLD